MNHTDNFVILPNDIYDNLNISNEELTVLVLLYRNYVQYKNIGVCSIQLLADYMMVNTSNNSKIITTLKEAVMSLVDKEYILNLYDVGFEKISSKNPIKNKYFPFMFELTPFPEDKFFFVYDVNLIHIFKQLQGINISKFNIIRYYIACCRVSNNDSNFGYLTQGKLKQLVTDSRTIQRYNKILQDDLQLIRYNNSYLTQDKHYCTTFIGKWEDEANFNKQLGIEVSSKGLIHTDKVKSNKKRSIQQKINNNIDNLSIDELEELLKRKKELEYKPKIESDKDIYVKSEKKPKGLQNKKKVIELDDSEFIKEMGWDKEINEESADFSEFIDWDEEDEMFS